MSSCLGGEKKIKINNSSCLRVLVVKRGGLCPGPPPRGEPARHRHRPAHPTGGGPDDRGDPRPDRGRPPGARRAGAHPAPPGQPGIAAGGGTGRLGEFLRDLGAESAALLALRPPCPQLEGLPGAHPLPLHGGIGREAAVHYALALAAERRVPLSRQQAGEIASAGRWRRRSAGRGRRPSCRSGPPGWRGYGGRRRRCGIAAWR